MIGAPDVPPRTSLRTPRVLDRIFASEFADDCLLFARAGIESRTDDDYLIYYIRGLYGFEGCCLAVLCVVRTGGEHGEVFSLVQLSVTS